MKLRDQYVRLHAILDECKEQPALPELASAMHCSQRHLRNLLADMQANGWLEWQAGRGRGHRSTLTMRVAPESLALDHLSDLLKRGELEQAFANLGKRQKRQLAARLPEYLGIVDQGCRRLRMPMYRPVENLDPLYVSGRLEAHLVRQIFSRLTTFDHETHSLRPSLAHHWEAQDDARIWHFWLRPAVAFHDGGELGPEEIKATFLRLRDTPATYQNLYRHLEKIEIGPGRRVSFFLQHSDHLWPQCLATANSSIVPRTRKTDFGRFPIGSGPFRVMRNNRYQITLQAFQNYYRERALLDEIDLWQIEPPEGSSSFDLHSGFGLYAASASTTRTLEEYGCAYLMIHPCRAFAATASQRLALADWLAPRKLFGTGDPARRVANGLLPDWKHRCAKASTIVPELPPRLRFVSGQTAEMLEIGRAVVQRLELAGVKVDWQTFNMPDLKEREWLDDCDLVLRREILHDDADFGCFEWFRSDAVFRRWFPCSVMSELDAALLRIQATADSAKRKRDYAAIGRKLVVEGLVIPLSHENHRITVAPHVAGVRIAPFGLVAFNELWLRESDATGS